MLVMWVSLCDRLACASNFFSAFAEPHRRVELIPRDVLERENLRNFRRGAVVEAAFGKKILRVPEGAEQDVKQRQVGIVVVVNAAAVMNAVTLGPLHDVAQPLRSADVQMLDH